MIIWTQELRGRDYEVIMLPDEERAAAWAAALSWARHDSREWVHRGRYVVGCELGLGYQVPSFEGIEPPEWAFTR